MPDRVHAWVDQMQAPTPSSVLDRAPTEPELAQLTARHDSVLAVGQRRNRGIRVRLTIYVMVD